MEKMTWKKISNKSVGLEYTHETTAKGETIWAMKLETGRWACQFAYGAHSGKRMLSSVRANAAYWLLCEIGKA
jgi:hypothetical protein